MTGATETPRPGLAALAVTVEHASFDYDGEPLFRDLSLALPAGRWTCLLGPSGVGKSTVLKLLAGLLEPAAGTRIAGADGGPTSGRVAYMAQQDLLLPWLSAQDNVALGARLRGEAPDRERAAALLAKVGLAGLNGRLPAQLSGGQRQRVALARTLMEDRALVLMDEPFTGLDSATRLRLQDLAAELLAGRTVLLVTHDPLEALRLGHEIRVLAGRPARLDAPLRPEGLPPRDPALPTLLVAQGELLARLRLAQDNGTGPDR